MWGLTGWRLPRLVRSLRIRGSCGRNKAAWPRPSARCRGNTRRDHAHKTALRLIRDNQAVYAEDLAVSGLARTRLAKSIHDAGRSQLLRLLAEKAQHYGRGFYRVGRFVPTSQTCNECGAIDGPKPLSVRAWKCAACDAVHDRDVNAARNILAAGRAERLNACGGDVRPPPAVAVPVEAGTHRGAA